MCCLADSGVLPLQGFMMPCTSKSDENTVVERRHLGLPSVLIRPDARLVALLLQTDDAILLADCRYEGQTGRYPSG